MMLGGLKSDVNVYSRRRREKSWLLDTASKLLKAKIGVAQDADAFLDKATRLLHHFSAENTDITELVHLIRNFLSQVEFEGLYKMRRHLRHFVILYRMPVKKLQRQQFLFSVDKLCLRNCPPPAYTLLPLSSILIDFNKLCVTVHNMKQNMGCAEEQLRPVLQCMVDRNDIDDVVCDTFLEHLDFAEPTLRIQGQVASAVDDEVFVFNSFISGRVNYLRNELRQVMNYDAFFQGARREVLLTFDALFNFQLDSP